MVFWKIYLWLLVLYLVLPIPFKLYGYLSGTDTSSSIVKIEEIINTGVFMVGAVGLHGFVYGASLGNPGFWYAWLVVVVAFSVATVFWPTPKLKYAESVLGKRNLLIATWIGTLLLLPLFVGVFLYGRVVSE